jgi:putative ABC transport system substrate-binding protein
MLRRCLLAATASALVLSTSHAGAAEPVRRVGVLWGFAIPEWTEAWLRGLREQGWVVGQNLKVDYRYYFDDVERIPALAAELATLEPDIVVAGGGCRYALCTPLLRQSRSSFSRYPTRSG